MNIACRDTRIKPKDILVFVCIAFVFLLLFSYSTSPLYIEEGQDSCVFKTMGRALLQGKEIYRDIFDHKGPILYFINAFGQLFITGKTGIFILQIIGLTIALSYMYKIAKLFHDTKFSYLSILCTLVFLAILISEGNQCEEWMLYSFYIAFYYAIKYFLLKSDNQHPYKWSLVYGLCFAFSFFIRPNDAFAWEGGIMASVTLWLIYKHEYVNCCKNILAFIIGAATITVPVLTYFAIHDTLSDLWYGLIGFNVEYSGGLHNYGLKKAFLSIPIAAILFFCYDKSQRQMMVLFVPMTIFACLLIGSKMFWHYMISFIPILFVSIIMILKRPKMVRWSLFILCFILGAAKVSSIPQRMYINKSFNARLYQEAESIFAMIPNNELDSVWNYNLAWSKINKERYIPEEYLLSDFSILFHKKVVQSNKITMGRSLRLTTEDNIKVKRPKWIIVNNSGDWPNITVDDSLFINRNYKKVVELNIKKVCLYKRVN